VRIRILHTYSTHNRRRPCKGKRTHRFKLWYIFIYFFINFDSHNNRYFLVDRSIIEKNEKEKKYVARKTEIVITMSCTAVNNTYIRVYTYTSLHKYKHTYIKLYRVFRRSVFLKCRYQKKKERLSTLFFLIYNTVSQQILI